MQKKKLFAYARWYMPWLRNDKSVPQKELIMKQPIIAPVNPDLIEQELTEKRFLRDTCRAGNKIYVVTAHNAPNTMREIGRLREEAFRAAGGGTGKECDIDIYDTMENPCRQLLVWNPDQREIVGAYRYLQGGEMIRDADGTPHIATADIFHFSSEFINDYLPVTIELGRSFVRLEYQATRLGVKSLYALDNLWDGLGALTVLHPDVEYLFGKMTMYTTYPRTCRNLLLRFLKMYFPDPDSLVTPIETLPDLDCGPEFDDFFAGDNFREDYKRLNSFVRQHGITIPPLVNAYMNLSPTMRILGTAINDDFGGVEETGLIIRIADITAAKKTRHVESFTPHRPEL